MLEEHQQHFWFLGKVSLPKRLWILRVFVRTLGQGTRNTKFWRPWDCKDVWKRSGLWVWFLQSFLIAAPPPTFVENKIVSRFTTWVQFLSTGAIIVVFKKQVFSETCCDSLSDIQHWLRKTMLSARTCSHSSCLTAVTHKDRKCCVRLPFLWCVMAALESVAAQSLLQNILLRLLLTSHPVFQGTASFLLHSLSSCLLSHLAFEPDVAVDMIAYNNSNTIGVCVVV